MQGAQENKRCVHFIIKTGGEHIYTCDISRFVSFSCVPSFHPASAVPKPIPSFFSLGQEFVISSARLEGEEEEEGEDERLGGQDAEGRSEELPEAPR